MEKVLFSKKIPIERKIFFLDLIKTDNGNYLKLTEKRNNIRNTVKIPDSGLSELQSVFEEIIRFTNRDKI